MFSMWGQMRSGGGVRDDNGTEERFIFEYNLLRGGGGAALRLEMT